MFASMQARCALLLDDALDLATRLRHHLLDARRVDAPIQDELGQRVARDLAADGIEAGEDDSLWRVVDDEVYAGRAFQRADVAPLAPDDAPFISSLGSGTTESVTSET